MVAIFALAIAGARVMIAQSAPAPATSISYVASVKLNTAPDARGLSEYSPGGRYRD
jgi:hypothetical protein